MAKFMWGENKLEVKMMQKQDVLNKLTNDWEALQKIVVYGFGRVAQRNIGKLYKDFQIQYIVDNDIQLRNSCFKGIKIKSFDDVKDEIIKYKIIVATSSYAYDSIKKGLNEIGLKEFKDYCRLEDFLPEWYWKYKKEVCLSQVFSSITSRCTFNCKYCNMLMPYYKRHYEYTEEDIIADMELLFQRVDYLVSYFVIGGEPLLNKNLGKILEKVNEKFSNKIGYIQVISNGSIVPDQDLIKVIKKCDVKVRLSDYTHVIPYDAKLQKVKNVLEENRIEYSMSIYETWMDLGFPEKVNPIGKTVKDVRSHMLQCSPGCHILSDKKFFYCGVVFSAEKCGLYHLSEGDFVDLQYSEGDLLADKERIMKYCLGSIDKGYISICNICRGSGSDNKRVIGVAEQVNRVTD